MSKKVLTTAQVEDRKAKAARFVASVLGDPDRADEIDDESIESYAERRGITIEDNNPKRLRSPAFVDAPRGKNMKNAAKSPSKEELLQKIQDLEDENDDLQDQLDSIADIVAPIEDEDGDEQEGDDDGEDDDPEE